MGISTLRSFIGSQIFEAVGWGRAVRAISTNTAPASPGSGFPRSPRNRARHRRGFRPTAVANADNLLDVGGVYQIRVDGERTCGRRSRLQAQSATRLDDYGSTRSTRRSSTTSPRRARHAAVAVAFRKGTPVPLDEVEPIEKILPRSVTAAMSFGSISKETTRRSPSR